MAFCLRSDEEEEVEFVSGVVTNNMVLHEEV
jgi:hypothetical protein